MICSTYVRTTKKNDTPNLLGQEIKALFGGDLSTWPARAVISRRHRWANWHCLAVKNFVGLFIILAVRHLAPHFETMIVLLFRAAKNEVSDTPSMQPLVIKFTLRSKVCLGHQIKLLLLHLLLSPLIAQMLTKQPLMRNENKAPIWVI